MLAFLVAAVAGSATLCAETRTSLEDVRAKIVSEIVPFSDRRADLLDLLLRGAGGRCREALTEYVHEIVKGKDKNVDAKGRLALILMAVRGEIPESAELVEMEVSAGRGHELLDTLRSADEVSYGRALRDWMRETAREIRKTQAMEQTGASAYGRGNVAENEGEKGLVRPLSPLMIERRLAFLIERREKLSQDELSDMNAIFAGSTAAYRDAFASLYKSVLATNVVPWIGTFRKESVWVQSRLFPLMSMVGGPEVVRELLWLSDNHADARIRGMADRSLDEILGTKKVR